MLLHYCTFTLKLCFKFTYLASPPLPEKKRKKKDYFKKRMKIGWYSWKTLFKFLLYEQDINGVLFFLLFTFLSPLQHDDWLWLWYYETESQSNASQWLIELFLPYLNCLWNIFFFLCFFNTHSYDGTFIFLSFKLSSYCIDQNLINSHIMQTGSFVKTRAMTVTIYLVKCYVFSRFINILIQSMDLLSKRF